MSRLILPLMTLALVLAVAMPGLHAAEAPADALIMNHMDGGDSDLAVTFNHTTHAAVECAECHHVEGEQQYASCATEGCHDVFDKKDKTSASYYMITHKNASLSTCVSCHKEEAGTDKELKKLLTGCKNSACHP